MTTKRTAMNIVYKQFTLREDEFQVILYETINGKSKDGKDLIREKALGWYSNVEAALLSLTRILASRDDVTVSIEEYIAKLKSIKEDIFNCTK